MNSETRSRGHKDQPMTESFDAYRTHLLALPEAIAAASEARKEELCRDRSLPFECSN